LLSLVWNAQGNKIAAGYEDGRIQILDASTGQVVLTIQAHTAGVFAIAWSPDGSRLISGGLYPDDSVRVWNAINGQPIFEFTNQGIDILVVSWSPDGNRFLAIPAEPPPVAQVRDAGTGNPLFSIATGTISDLVWSPDGSRVATATAAGEVGIHDGTTLQFITSFTATRATTGGNQLSKVAWNNDATRIVSGSLNGTVRVWNTTTGVPIFEVQGNDYQGSDVLLKLVNNVYFSSDGSTFSSVSGDGTVRTWNSTTGQLVTTTQLGSPVYASAVSPDKSKLAYGGSSPGIQIIQNPATCNFTIAAENVLGLINAINTATSNLTRTLSA
jgi:WD40 repeat protein